MNKENIYDSQVSPLMQQVIAICKDNGIAMMASFDIAHDGEGPNGEDCSALTCNTLLPDGEGKNNPLFVHANDHIRRRGRPAPMMLTTSRSDGGKTAIAIL